MTEKNMHWGTKLGAAPTKNVIKPIEDDAFIMAVCFFVAISVI